MSIYLLDGYLSKSDFENGEQFSTFAGKVLRGCLSAVGIEYNECIKDVVFPFHPQGNSIKGIAEKKGRGVNPNILKGRSAVVKGWYLRKEYEVYLQQCTQRILAAKPTLIVSLGSEALWFLADSTGLKSVRGTTMYCDIGNSKFKLLPTFSPDEIVTRWKEKPIFLSDLSKASREQHFSEVRRPRREVWIYPTIEDILGFEKQYIEPSDDLSIDIETSGTQITCIGFAPSIDRAIVIPFTDRENKTGSYWPDFATELTVWEIVRRICGKKKPRVVGQNFLYDINHLWANYGIQVRHANHDTMLLHHAMQPEMQKGLGFMGSVYTDEASWKFMRVKHSTIKRED